MTNRAANPADRVDGYRAIARYRRSSASRWARERQVGGKMEERLSEYARQLQSLLLELDSPSERRAKLETLLEGERVAEVFDVSFLKSPKIFARGQRLESLEREIYPEGTTLSQDHQNILSTLLASTGDQ